LLSPLLTGDWVETGGQRGGLGEGDVSKRRDRDKDKDRHKDRHKDRDRD
jgi:hypothetical protein